MCMVPVEACAYPARMKTALTSLITLLATAAPALAGISQPAQVVELFTSQGCSSCPPANGFVVGLSENDPEALALSYGVTYWDYLGWKDTFGDPAFTDRQRQYRASLPSSMYTPQIVINGTEDAPRFKRSDVKRHTLAMPVSLTETSEGLTVSGNLPDGAKLAIVHYTPGTQTVAVKRGENHGRTLTLANVVTGIGYADWNGQALTLDAPDEALAVLVHDGRTGAVVGAATFVPDDRKSRS